MDFHCFTFCNVWNDDFFSLKEGEKRRTEHFAFGFESQGEVDVCHSTARKLEDLPGSFLKIFNISPVGGTS